jgi:hypothetical protein
MRNICRDLNRHHKNSWLKVRPSSYHPDQSDKVGRKLQMQTLKALAVGMPGVPPGFFEEYHDEGDNQLRLLHCEPVGNLVN